MSNLVWERVEIERKKWEKLNHTVITTDGFIAVLLENYTQDFDSQAFRVVHDMGRVSKQKN